MGQNSRIEKIKKICTLLMLVSFFLPVAKSCSEINIPNTAEGKPLISWHTKNPLPHTGRDIYVPETPVAKDLAIVSLVFFWPVPFFFLGGARKHIILYPRIIGELALGLLAAQLYIFPVVFIGEALIGAYIYFSATAIYLCTTLFEFGQTIKAHLQHQTRHPHDSG